MKILISTPICDVKNYCWAEYYTALNNMIDPAGYEFSLHIVDSSDKPSQKIVDQLEAIKYPTSYEWVNAEKPMDKVVKARNAIFEYAIVGGFSHVLFVDSDVIVEPDTFTRLLSALARHDPNWSVVTGNYLVTTPNGFPTPAAKLWTKIGWMNFPESHLDGTIHEVDMTGLGCTLIPRRIFEIFGFRCLRLSGEVVASEDMEFFRDLQTQTFRIKPIKVLYDTSINFKHLVGGDFSWDRKTA